MQSHHSVSGVGSRRAYTITRRSDISAGIQEWLCGAGNVLFFIAEKQIPHTAFKCIRTVRLLEGGVKDDGVWGWMLSVIEHSAP